MTSLILAVIILSLAMREAGSYTPEDGGTQTLDDRMFPLYAEAVSWESIEWKNYSKIIVSGPQRSGTTVRKNQP